jgi:hypothetical protein
VPCLPRDKPLLITPRSPGSREKVNDANQVVIVDLADANNVIRRPSEFILVETFRMF